MLKELKGKLSKLPKKTENNSKKKHEKPLNVLEALEKIRKIEERNPELAKKMLDQLGWALHQIQFAEQKRKMNADFNLNPDAS